MVETILRRPSQFPSSGLHMEAEHHLHYTLYHFLLPVLLSSPCRRMKLGRKSEICNEFIA